jgi:hypothetical protein
MDFTRATPNASERQEQSKKVVNTQLKIAILYIPKTSWMIDFLGSKGIDRHSYESTYKKMGDGNLDGVKQTTKL